MSWRPSLAANIASNYAAQAWSISLALVMTPLYLKWLGLEAYGLIGVFAAMQGLLAWADMGISPTMARLISQLSSRTDAASRREMSDVAATYLIVSVGIGSAAGLAIIALSPFSRYWIHVGSLPPATVALSVALMGATIVLLWPSNLAIGGLMALERQVEANAISACSSGIRALTTAFALLHVATDIKVFFLAQAAGTAIGTLSAVSLLALRLPGHNRSFRFRKELLSQHLRFTAGVTVSNLATAVATQIGAVTLAKILIPAEFGLFSLARTVSNAIGNASTAMVGAFYPRLCKLAVAGPAADLAGVYHFACQLVSVASMSICLTVAVFSRELLFAWTANPDIMVRAAPVLTLLAIGAAFQAMLLLPYLLQLAAGLTKLSTLTTLAVFVLTIPVTVWASLNWGAVGGAAAWIIYNFVYLLLYLPLMHRRLLVGELPAWLGFDVAAPAVGAGIVLLLFRVLWTAPTNRWLCALMLSVVGAVALVAAAACAGRVRRAVAQFIRAFTTRKLRPRTQN